MSDELIDVARIKGEIVVNIEVASPEWVSEQNALNGEYFFVEFDESQPAHIGYGWDSQSGFDQPPLLSLANAIEHPEPVDEFRASIGLPPFPAAPNYL